MISTTPEVLATSSYSSSNKHMDSDHLYQFSTSTSIVIGLFILLFFLVLLWKPKKPSSTSKPNKPTREQRAPEPSSSWPIIGHLRLFGGPNNLPHITLGAMADKYGPVFTIRMGSRPVLVVSSWEMAKECFTTNDRVFASRPRTIAIKHMCYEHVMLGFAPYGSYWRELRKIVNRELLSNNRLELLKHVWGSEINTSIKELYELWLVNKNNIEAEGENEGTSGRVLVEMKRWFADLTLNMSIKIVVGKRYPSGVTAGGSSGCDDDEAQRCRKALRDFFKLVGLFLVSDAIPFLRWLDWGGYEREMKTTARELDCLMEEWLEEHKMKRRLLISPSAGDHHEAAEIMINKQKEAELQEYDFMDVMLSILDDDIEGKNLSDYDVNADTINKSTCLNLILGGSDTTMVTLTWALALLLNNPHVLQKAQDELDIHVGSKRQVDDSDMKNLIYLQAIVKETMRLYPAGPLSVPHESTEDCTVAGYHVPAGTRLIVNTWKIQRDPRVWSNPSEFKPERFLTDSHVDIDVRGRNFELIPFGSGRRSCPGTSFALQVVHLVLARLIHGFEFKTPSEAPIDMTESVGLSNFKATPLDVLLTPRLPSQLYYVS